LQELSNKTALATRDIHSPVFPVHESSHNLYNSQLIKSGPASLVRIHCSQCLSALVSPPPTFRVL